MIEGFQHLGICVSDVRRSSDFYRRILGFRIKLSDHEQDLSLLLGDQLERMTSEVGPIGSMHIILRHDGGEPGAAVELFQDVTRTPAPLPEDLRWGDLGHLSAGVKAYGLERLVPLFEKKGAEFVTGIQETEVGDGTWRSAYLRDPDGILIELLETGETRTRGGRPRLGGFSHVTVGVSDMGQSLEFYSRALGYDSIVFDRTDVPAGLAPAGEEVRTVMLKRSRRTKSMLPFENGMLKLVQAMTFEGRPWLERRRFGDVCIMELAFDVIGMDEAFSRLIEAGAEPFCTPGRIDMGYGLVVGFAYARDPDGNLVELIEIERMGFLPPRIVGPLLTGALKVSSRL